MPAREPSPPSIRDAGTGGAGARGDRLPRAREPCRMDEADHRETTRSEAAPRVLDARVRTARNPLLARGGDRDGRARDGLDEHAGSGRIGVRADDPHELRLDVRARGVGDVEPDRLAGTNGQAVGVSGQRQHGDRLPRSGVAGHAGDVPGKRAGGSTCGGRARDSGPCPDVPARILMGRAPRRSMAPRTSRRAAVPSDASRSDRCHTLRFPYAGHGSFPGAFAGGSRQPAMQRRRMDRMRVLDTGVHHGRDHLLRAQDPHHESPPPRGDPRRGAGRPRREDWMVVQACGRTVELEVRRPPPDSGAAPFPGLVFIGLDDLPDEDELSRAVRWASVRASSPSGSCGR